MALVARPPVFSHSSHLWASHQCHPTVTARKTESLRRDLLSTCLKIGDHVSTASVGSLARKDKRSFGVWFELFGVSAVERSDHSRGHRGVGHRFQRNSFIGLAAQGNPI